MEKKNLLGINITNATEKEILKYILYTLEKTSEKYYIVTPNPEILVYAIKHEGFKDILNQAQIALCDGVGLMLAGIILGKTFKDRVTGVDLMENLCKQISEKPITVGFLGGGKGIAEKTAECLIRRYPNLRVVFTASEWEASEKNKKIDILFVAFGFPKQEEWMHDNLDKGYFRIAIGVGGAFDYISGNVHRAPLLVRLIGFEWLFRLIVQPWRIKRQFALLEFIKLVIREKLGKN